jgi:site-specific recombinase XerD
MGTDLELPFPLSFHASRHTFATRALTKGMRIEHVSKILDHTEISTTQIYAKIVSEELDKAMEIMNN